MDQNTLVDGGDEGLRQIARAFREAGTPVEAIYLIKRRGLEDDEPKWTIVAVISPFRKGADSDFIITYVDLRRAGRLPFIDPQVRMVAVGPDDIEASRLLAYARRSGRAPMAIRNMGWEGLYIENALLAEDLGPRAEAA